MIYNKSTDCFVGFDTSNYTTSVAFADADGRIIANLKSPLPVKEGEKGLRQSDAVFSHVRNLPALTDMLSKEISGYNPIAVGVSSTPRDAEGSYMPCFLCGIAAAHSFASALGIPVIETSHQDGHIMAAIYSSGAAEKLLGNRFLAFHVSGGTTEALLVTPHKDGKIFGVELVGETADINAGQAIDRVGVMLGLSFPCGKELEKLAASFDGKPFKQKITVRDRRCSLSGVENIARKLYEEGRDSSEIASFVFDFICRTLCEMTSQILNKYGDMPVLFAGGVMSNKIMRSEISSRFEAYFAEPEFSADNASGVALLTRLRYTEDNKL